jgi:hypothetical protein
MLQVEVLRPWIRLSFDTFRLGLQVQSSMMSLLNSGRALMMPAAQEAPTPIASALAGTPYAPEVVQAVKEEIASEEKAAEPAASRVNSRQSSRQASRGGAHKAAKPTAKKPPVRKAPARRKR